MTEQNQPESRQSLARDIADAGLFAIIVLALVASLCVASAYFGYSYRRHVDWDQTTPKPLVSPTVEAASFNQPQEEE